MQWSRTFWIYSNQRSHFFNLIKSSITRNKEEKGVMFSFFAKEQAVQH